MSGAATIQFQRKDGFIGLNCAELSISSIFYHWHNYAFHNDIGRSLTTVYLLVKQMSDLLVPSM